MYLTSVLLVINDKFNAVDIIEENLKIAGSRTQLLVYNNGCRTSEIISEVRSLSTLFLENDSPIEKTFPECVNELLRLSSGEFIFVVDQYCYFEESWLKKLCDSYSNFKSGVISFNKTVELPIEYTLDSNDELIGIYNENNVVTQLPFFKKELLHVVGGFNSGYDARFSIIDFSFRIFNFYGYLNYYIPELNYVSYSYYFDDYSINQIQAKNQIFTQKNQFIEIFNITPLVSEIIDRLKNHFNDKVIFSNKLGAIFINNDRFNQNDLIFIAEIISQYNIQLEMFPQSYFDDYILKSSIIILIRK
jgi:hypothetical protein